MAALKHRIQFYSSLATLESAGVPPLRAFAQRMPGAYQKASADILVLLKRGQTLAEAMACFPRLFSPLEVSLVQVGEMTGHRDTIYLALRDWFQLTSRLRGLVITGMLYPALVYHVAAVLIPFISIFLGGTSILHAARNAALMLAAPWIILLLSRMFGASLLRIGPIGSAILNVPLIGGLIYRLDCTRFFMAYALCLRSGLGGTRPVQMAAACCRNVTLRQRFGDIGDIMSAAGCSFSDALAQRLHSRDQKSMILELMHTGELAGTSDEAAERIANLCREEAETILTRVAVLLPTLLYLCLAVYLGFKIITFYSQLLAPVRELLE